MNIFEHHLLEIKDLTLNNKKFLKLDKIKSLNIINLEIPPEKFNFDLSCNIALVLAKENNQEPKKLAEKIKKVFLEKIKNFSEIEIAGPGFLNIKLSNKAIINNINLILKNNKTYGSFTTNDTYNIEFVSANPTGPMHVGHCRGAIYGDVLANLLKFNGNEVTKEYYINDYGNQIKNFVESVYLRIREIKFKEKYPQNENLYPGLYIKDIAAKIIREHNKVDFKNLDINFKLIKKESLNASMNLIKEDLKQLGISHDKFFSETEMVNKDLVNIAVQKLKNKNYIKEGYLEPPKGESDKNWRKIKRLIFKSTLFGDDTDRSLQKNDGSWTYFANDVAYHMDKVNRKYKHLINILGADHTGYIKRITAAVSALSENKILLNCKVCQLVKLFKNGEPFKMSKRAGEFISVKDLLKEVNKDPIRFMMLNRSNDVELDFDFDKVKEKTKENPVFYVQYAYARINSLLRALNLNFTKKVDFDANNFNPNDIEKKIIRKVFEWPKIIESASRKFDLHKIPYFLYDLSTLFHAYWSKGNDDQNYKFIENKRIKREEIIVVINLVAVVIQNGMRILGVSLPDKM